MLLKTILNTNVQMTKLILGDISFNKDHTKTTVHEINVIVYCPSFEVAFSLGEELTKDGKSNFFIVNENNKEVVYECTEFFV